MKMLFSYFLFFLYDERCYNSRESIRFAIITIFVIAFSIDLVIMTFAVEIGKSNNKSIAYMYCLFWILMSCAINTTLLILIRFYISFTIVPLVVIGIEKLTTCGIREIDKKNNQLSKSIKIVYESNKLIIRILQILIPVIITIFVNVLNLY